MALAFLWVGEGKGVRSRSQVCPSLLVRADLSDLEALGAGDRKAPPSEGGGGEEEKGHSLGKEAERQLQCREGCARVCQARSPTPGSFCTPRCGADGPPAQGAEEAPLCPGLGSAGRPAVLQAGAHWAGRTTRPLSPPPPLAACPPLSPLSFPCTGAHQWSCSGMHTQLATGGG